MNKKLFKKTWPLWCIIPFIIWIAIALLSSNQGEIQFQTPEAGSGAMVFYDGQWIGGDIVGEVIVLKNGTEMDLNEFKRITGFKLE